MEVDRIDVAVLAKELTEIYSTPTPKGWPKPKKVSNLYLIDCVFDTMVGGLYLYPGLTQSPNHTRLDNS